MDGTEGSPARGLKSMLSRNRRGKDEGTPDPADSRSTRAQSSESLREKFKPRPSNAEDTNEPNSSNAFRVLSSRGSRKSKTGRKGRRGSVEDDNSTYKPVPITPSSLQTGDDESANGSLNDGESNMTSDSEGDRQNASATATSIPPLRPRESHAGYLTSSSPQVKTLPVSSPNTKSPGNANTNMAEASTLYASGLGSARIDRPSSVSPHVGVRDPLGSSFTKFSTDTEETVASRRQSKGSGNSTTLPLQIQTYDAAINQSNKSLPSIVMTPETPPPMPHGQYEQSISGSYEKLSSRDSPSPATKRQQSKRATETQHSSSIDGGSGRATNPSFISLAHRRARSDSQTTHPSKLSHSMNPPLTPMIEEVKTPPSSKNAPIALGGGFFNSVFSVAQNAANTITGTLSNTSNRPKTSTSYTQLNEDGGMQDDAQPEEATVPSAEAPSKEADESSKPLAIDTIGSGELSLSHLGIMNDTSPSLGTNAMPSSPMDPWLSRSRSGTVVRRDEAAAREEGLSAARAVSAAYEEKSGDIVTPMVEDVAADNSKTQPPIEGSILGDHTTPNGSIVDGDTGSVLGHHNSLKKKIGSKRRRRGGSQSTIGAALAASGTNLLAAANGSAQKLAGFAVASKKRNRDFHLLFRSVPEDDYLIEDYSCALQRDIILAGRIYISEGHICFSSNILGWVTTLVISFDEVMSVEKENTAMVFPNAIAVQTLHARHTFRSLLSRETTYDLLIGIWKINHPGLMSSENGVRVANGTGSKTEKLEDAHSDGESDGEGSDDQEGDDDDASVGSDDGRGSSVASGEGTNAALDASASPPKSTIPRKVSTMATASGQASSPPTVTDSKAAAQATGAAIAAVDFPGPQSHAPTECSDQSTHYATMLKDETIPAPLGKVFALTFGAASGGFMARWLVDEQKVMDLQMEDDKKGLGDEIKTRSFSYIKPLGGSIGPKQTKCIITEQLDSFDLEKAASITVTTQTPDVPSGNVFSTKTRYCFMWGPGNTTRMIMTCVIEWTGKSWLKGPIEKGANDGQMTYANDLCKALRAAVSKDKVTPTAAGGKRKSKKKKSDADKSTSSVNETTVTKKADWGPLEPLHGILVPVGDILGPVFTSYTLIGLLSVLLIYTWLFRSSPSAKTVLPGRAGHGARIAAYEQLWRSEEAELWHWLEQRVGGAEGLTVPIGRTEASGNRKASQYERQRGLKGEDGRAIGEREVQRAVQITEEKLQLLKDAIGIYREFSGGDTKKEKSEL